MKKINIDNKKNDNLIKKVRFIMTLSISMILTLPSDFPLWFLFFSLIFLVNYFFHYSFGLTKNYLLSKNPRSLILFELLINPLLGYTCWYIHARGLKYQLLIAMFGSVAGLIFGIISCIIFLTLRIKFSKEKMIF